MLALGGLNGVRVRCGTRCALRRVDETTSPVNDAAEEPFEELLARSSLGHLWVDCPTHGRQPVDPFEEGDVCLLCAIPTSHA